MEVEPDWVHLGYTENGIAGDVINVYGKECIVDEAGHIKVSADDEFSDTKIQYPDGKTL